VKLLLDGKEWECPRPELRQIDLERTRVVAVQIVSFNNKLDEFATKVAASTEESLEAVLDERFLQEAVVDKLSKELHKRLARFLIEANPELHAHLEAKSPAERAAAGLDLFAQIFMGATGGAPAIKN